MWNRYKNIIYAILITFILSSCQPTQEEKLLGKWLCVGVDTGGIINYFKKIEFKADSIFLKDENFIDYKASYLLNKNKITIADSTYTIEILGETILKLFNLIFIRENDKTNAIYGKHVPIDIGVTLPTGVSHKRLKIKQGKEKHPIHDNITIGLDKGGREVLCVGNSKMQFKDLPKYLELPHTKNADREIYLYIDKNAIMGFVDSLFTILDSIGLRDIAFILQDNGFNNSLTPSNRLDGFIPFTPLSSDILFEEGILKMYFGGNNNTPEVINIKENKIFISGIETDTSLLMRKLNDILLDEKAFKSSIILLYDSSTTYGMFIKEMLMAENLYHSVWDATSKKIYKKPYSNLSQKEWEVIFKKKPKRFLFFREENYKRLKEIPVPYCGM